MHPLKIKFNLPALNLDNFKGSEKSNHLNLSDESSSSTQDKNDTTRGLKFGHHQNKAKYISNIYDLPLLRKRVFSLMPAIKETNMRTRVFLVER